MRDRLKHATTWQWLEERLDQLRDDLLTRQLTPLDPAADQGRLHLVSGQKRWINFGGNDYLGLADQLASEPSLTRDATSLYGSSASPLVTGYTAAQKELESTLAEFEEAEGALVFPTGYAANLAVMSTLPEAGDVILSDELNHASIIDGCRLSHAERFIYPHGDASAVAALLKAHRSRFRRAFIVTDSIFSMDGDVAPLAELTTLAEAHEAILIVDEAHGTGVLGEHGAGVCEWLGLQHRIPIRVGTLSKAVGALGGFVVGPRVVIDYLINRARPLIYSTAMPEALARLACLQLERLRVATERRKRLQGLIARFHQGLPATFRKGLPSDPVSPIIPLVVGDSGVALQFAARLRDAGCFVPAIRPPTVPPRTARLRVSLSAGHTDADLETLLSALGNILNT